MMDAAAAKSLLLMAGADVLVVAGSELLVLLLLDTFAAETDTALGAAGSRASSVAAAASETEVEEDEVGTVIGIGVDAPGLLAVDTGIAASSCCCCSRLKLASVGTMESLIATPIEEGESGMGAGFLGELL